jgi:glycosyltransferase involved in cell wall biosynthesis
MVAPMYRTAAHLEELHARLASALEGSWELILVDDACPDGSLERGRAIALRDDRVSCVGHPRRLGQHRALITGLSRARADVVVLMDADLQHPPEAIPSLVARLRGRSGAVFAGGGAREGAPARLSSRIYKAGVALLAGIPRDAGTFVAVDRPTADRLLAMNAASPTLPVAIGATGAPSCSLHLGRRERPGGRSAYTPIRRARLAARTIAWAVWWRAVGRRRMAWP